MVTVWQIAPPLPRRQLIAQLVEQCTAAGLPAPLVRYRGAALGRWTFPLGWPQQRLLVDLAGGRYRNGALVRGLTGTSDFAKGNAATLAGWRVLRFTPAAVADGSAVRQIAAALGSRAATP